MSKHRISEIKGRIPEDKRIRHRLGNIDAMRKEGDFYIRIESDGHEPFPVGPLGVIYSAPERPPRIETSVEKIEHKQEEKDEEEPIVSNIMLKPIVYSPREKKLDVRSPLTLKRHNTLKPIERGGKRNIKKTNKTRKNRKSKRRTTKK